MPTSQANYTLKMKGLGFSVYLEVHRTYNLLSNCSYNPIISRVAVVMELIFRYNYSWL